MDDHLAKIEAERKRLSEQAYEELKRLNEGQDELRNLIERIGSCLQEERIDWDVLREYFEEMSNRVEDIARRIDRIERAQLLLLVRRSHLEKEEQSLYVELENQQHENRMREEEQRRKERLKDLLSRHERNLERLRSQAARFGASEVPLSLLNDIEEEEEAVKRLREELA